MPVYFPPAPSSPANTQNVVPSQVFNKWRKAMTNVKDGTSNARILCIGDSTTAGFGSSSYSSGIPQTNSWPSRLAALMNTSLLPAAVGLGVPPSWISNNTDNRWTLGSNWGFNNGSNSYGAGSCCYVYGSATSGNLVFTPSPQVSCNGFYVYYLGVNGNTGSATATATGGSGTVIATNTGDFNMHRILVSAGSTSTSNTLTIALTASGGTYIIGVEPVLSTKSQVLVGNAGAGGVQTNNWSSTTSSTYSGIALITTYAPDLSIISLGINDSGASVSASSFATNMQALITAAKTSGDVLLCDFPATNPSSYPTDAVYQPQYLSRYAQLAAANKCAYLSFYNRLGGAYNSSYMYSDGIHCTDQGYWDWAQFIASVISAP